MQAILAPKVAKQCRSRNIYPRKNPQSEIQNLAKKNYNHNSGVVVSIVILSGAVFPTNILSGVVVPIKIPYRTTDPFKADFGEFWDTLFLAKVCLEHKISYEILPE